MTEPQLAACEAGPDEIGIDVVARSVKALDRMEAEIERLLEHGLDADSMDRIKALNALILSTTRVTRNVALAQRVAKVELENRKLRTEVETLAKKLHEEVVRRAEHAALPDSRY